MCRLETEMESPLPLQLETQPLARDILCRFPTIGTILRVSVSQRNVKLNIPSLAAGRWVKYINLLFEVNKGLWRGVITSSTKVRFVPNEDLIILERQRLVTWYYSLLLWLHSSLLRFHLRQDIVSKFSGSILL